MRTFSRVHLHHTLGLPWAPDPGNQVNRVDAGNGVTISEDGGWVSIEGPGDTLMVPRESVRLARPSKMVPVAAVAGKKR